MGKSHVKLNYAGFQAIRQSGETRQAVTEAAEQIADRANRLRKREAAHYTSVPAMQTKQGVVALATTGHYEPGSVDAMLDNQENDTLLKAAVGGTQ